MKPPQNLNEINFSRLVGSAAPHVQHLQAAAELQEVGPDIATCIEHQGVGLVAVGRRIAGAGGIGHDERHLAHRNTHAAGDGHGDPRFAGTKRGEKASNIDQKG